MRLTPSSSIIQTARQRATRRAAFTLLEVLIVVAILVILGGAASVAYFRYLEDAKAGRAQNDMRVIAGVYQKYYGENGHWPPQITDIAPQLENGQQGLLDPWLHPYQVQINTVAQPDGTTQEKPLVICQPPNGKPAITYPKSMGQ